MIRRSELRQDIVSGDWILLAPGRAKRPESWRLEGVRKHVSRAQCPFEHAEKTNGPILIYEGKNGWDLAVVHNLYPAVFERKACGVPARRGPYATFEGVGYHNLVITKDHDANFSRLSKAQAFQVFRAFRERYVTLSEDPCVAYVSIFHNWGPKAGASVYHPHYQIIAIPVIPPDVEHSLRGSALFYRKHGVCVHCRMLEFERKEKKRIIFENEHALVVAPFVSREPFEVRVFPKKHRPSLADTPDPELEGVALALHEILGRLEVKLGDPDYNFFIHTSPAHESRKSYHWHIEVIPKMNIAAGFELGTGMEINIVDPDDAAKLLRK